MLVVPTAPNLVGRAYRHSFKGYNVMKTVMQSVDIGLIKKTSQISLSRIVSRKRIKWQGSSQ